MNTKFQVGQKIRMTYSNGVFTEGTIVEIKSDRIRAVPFGQADDGIGFGFAFRAIGKVIAVEII
jgi:hypothetical protein